MAETRSDVTRLIQFSLEYKLDTALVKFPMFSKHQIRAVYAMSKSQRLQLLAERTVGGSISSVEEALETHRSPAQVVKLIEVGTDPSNT